MVLTDLYYLLAYLKTSTIKPCIILQVNSLILSGENRSVYSEIRPLLVNVTSKQVEAQARGRSFYLHLTQPCRFREDVTYN